MPSDRESRRTENVVTGPEPMGTSKVGSDSIVLFASAIGLTFLALLIDSEAVGWVIGPIVLLLIIVVMAKVPLRVSLLALMFCALTLENPAEIPASGQWQSPLFVVGGLLLNHLNTTTGIRALFMSGMDILLVALSLIALQREAFRSKIDRVGRVATPRPLVKLAHLSLAGTAFVFLSGMVRGGDVSMSLWQMDRVVYLPIIFLLFHLGLRGPADHVALGKVIIAAATIRALLATYVIHTVYMPPDENGIVTILPYATSHHDSVLFATAFVLLLALVLSGARGKSLRVVWAVLPILVLGMISNHRRMVWVQVALVFLTLYLTTPTNPVRKKVRAIALALAPILSIYAFAGWNSESSVFKPVHIMRSIIDSKSDNSTLWRDIENYDLISTIRENPIFGTGYGHGYHEVVQLPPVDYSLELYCPHNSILGLWGYCGYFGYAAMTLLWVVGAYFAMRGYYTARNPNDRAAALSSFGVVLVYLVQCWGDLGLGAWTGVFLMAPAIASAGKLAAATGAWSDPSEKTRDRVTRPVVPMPGHAQSS